MLIGTYTALVTPFSEGQVDWESFEKILEHQIAGGVEGVVPVGTTGESPTLSHDEHVEVIRFCVKKVKKRCQVIAGTGSNSTQEGLYQHFAAIAESTDLPLILYSIPGRCVVEIAVETVAKLAANHKTIIGIKEAGGKVERIAPLRKATSEKFTILSGDDALTLPFMRESATGVISVASNLLPGEVSHMVRAFRQGNVSEAEALEKRLAPTFRDLFIETNPMPIKAAMAMKGMLAEEYRLPMVPMQPETRAQLEKTLKAGGWL